MKGLKRSWLENQNPAGFTLSNLNPYFKYQFCKVCQNEFQSGKTILILLCLTLVTCALCISSGSKLFVDTRSTFLTDKTICEVSKSMHTKSSQAGKELNFSISKIEIRPWNKFVFGQVCLTTTWSSFYWREVPLSLFPIFLKVNKLDHETDLFSDTFVGRTWTNFLLDGKWCNDLKLIR